MYLAAERPPVSLNGPGTSPVITLDAAALGNMMESTEDQASTSELLDEIARLRRERNAVILAHYYQIPAIQDLADVCGDSLALAQAARRTEAEVIVFAGVNFMADTAKILNPNKTVVVPDIEAGCSLADDCPGEEFASFRKKHADHVAVSYINCSIEVKAHSDLVCTSSNAQTIIESIPRSKKILFAPDINLGRYLMHKTGRDMLLWNAVCVVHDVYREEDLLRLKAEHPEAEVLAHPECRESILRHADLIGSTSKIIEHGAASKAPAAIIATESGVIHQMSKRAPSKLFIPMPGESPDAACSVCPYMRLNTVEKLRDCLRDLQPRIEVDSRLGERALAPIERMLALST